MTNMYVSINTGTISDSLLLQKTDNDAELNI